MNLFHRPMQGRMKSPNDDCKIKIKKTMKGREISFGGNCSKEQIAIAKENLDTGNSVD
jgi:hypothetical protein